MVLIVWLDVLQLISFDGSPSTRQSTILFMYTKITKIVIEQYNFTFDFANKKKIRMRLGIYMNRVRC